MKGVLILKYSFLFLTKGNVIKKYILISIYLILMRNVKIYII